jgi:hypothetical protein
MKVSRYQLWSALLYSTERTPEIDELMKELERDMKKASKVVVEEEK